MARYVIAHRRAGMFTESEKLASRASVANAIDTLPIIDIVEDHRGGDSLSRRTLIVELNPSEVEAHRQELGPTVIIEPEVFYWRDVVPPVDKIGLSRTSGALPANAIPGSTLVMSVLGDGAPLPGASITIFTSANLGRGVEIKAISDQSGQCQFRIPLGHNASAAVVSPEGGFWVMIVRGQQLLQPVDCPPLPMNGPTSWWHDALLPGGLDSNDGNGIRVGVADTGIWDTPVLGHATAIHAFIGGQQLSPNLSTDVDTHGTHVAGIIGARPRNAGQYTGLAPASDLFCTRIFPDADSGASNADIANAIDALSRDHRVDLINLSLGGGSHSTLIADAVTDAFERGTLCIIAAGNENGPVSFPGRLPNAIAVSALGLEGQYPNGSLSAARLPNMADRFGHNGLFAANFTCFGPDLDTAGPGVGIIAPVSHRISPNPHYGVMDGTSMAAPSICGALATLMSRNAIYGGLARDAGRAEYARQLLFAHCRSVGLPAVVEGRGMLSS
jgi:hypothetical protein